MLIALCSRCGRTNDQRLTSLCSRCEQAVHEERAGEARFEEERLRKIAQDFVTEMAITAVEAHDVRNEIKKKSAEIQKLIQKVQELVRKEARLNFNVRALSTTLNTAQVQNGWAVKHKGEFIVLEGIDGSGKSVQAKRLTEFLKAKGTPALSTGEPWSGAAAQQDHETQLDYFTRQRAAHLKDLVLPALQTGTHVICDRYLLSTAAYQPGPKGREEAPWQEKLDLLHEQFRHPDLVLILDLPAPEALRRVEARGEKSPFETLETLEAVRATYQEMAETLPAIHLIDATQSEDTVFRAICEAVQTRLPQIEENRKGNS